MKIEDVIGKVLYINSENMYYYFTHIHNNMLYYGLWEPNSSKKILDVRKGEMWSWSDFIKVAYKEEIEVQTIEDNLERCTLIQRNLISKTFNEWYK